MTTDPRREEQQSKLVNEYKNELAALTDVEFWQHWQAQQRIHNMTEQDWEQAYKQDGIKV